jgi:transposase, IS5 family
MTRLCKAKRIVGWRKSKNWQKELKIKMRICWQVQRSGGKNKPERVEKAVINYTQKASELNLKVKEGLALLRQSRLSTLELAEVIQIEYFQKMLVKHIDLIERRLIKGDVIPHEEKVFSLFEPFTHWINKGKSHPSVELGRKILITTDQYDLILRYKVMDQSVDKNETLSEMEILFHLYGENAFDSISFDKGFSVKEDREILELFIPNVIMPKKGRLNSEDKAREGSKKFKLLRNKHSAIESNINMLEHHGLNRCPDKGFRGFKRYAGLGVLAYNCHKIGNKLFEKEKLKLLKKAA